MILGNFELHFGILWLSGGCPGLPWGALGSPWAPGRPQQRFRERNAGSLDPPLASQMRSFWHQFSLIFRIKKALVFDWVMVTIFSGRWCQNASRNHSKSIEKLIDFVDWFLSGIWCRFASVQGLLNLDFCNTFYAKTCFLEFDLTLIW